MVEAKAVLKYARMSPTKVRRVVDLIRGRKAGEALLSLRFMPYRASENVEKLLMSAMANAEQKGAEPEDMIISEVLVDQGPTMKRMRARAMGRANVIKKRSSHITLMLRGNED
jgi:large subunit ribosomal protein L22